MLEYPINSWEPVLTGCEDGPLPSFFVVPDVQLLKYFLENGNRIECYISDTGIKNLDNHTFLATVDKSNDLPNNRSDYDCRKTHYILTLTNCTDRGSIMPVWTNYPSSNGKVVFLTGSYRSYNEDKCNPLPEEIHPENTTPIQENKEVIENYEAPEEIVIPDKRNKRLFHTRMLMLFLLSVGVGLCIYMLEKENK